MDLKMHWQEANDDVKPDALAWPTDAVSAVVIGIAHPAEKPELDWWDGRGTPGNRILIQINGKLSQWIESTFSAKTYKLPYFVEKGGIFLKDAVVRAGLGCVGRNNLVVTPGYGPRIRFRALLLNRQAEATGPLEFNPCVNCDRPCRKACPVKAFQNTVYSSAALGQSELPGIGGAYDRVTCNVKMEKDIEDAVVAIPAGDAEHQDVRRAIDEFEGGAIPAPTGDRAPFYRVKYCRRCELACPVGKPGWN